MQSKEKTKFETVRTRNREKNKHGMMKCYQMYGKKASKLAEKSQKNTGKGEKNGYSSIIQRSHYNS